MYTFESRVRFSEADHTELLTLPGLVNYFQDCSTFQSEDIGYGVESLKKSGQAWILSAWQIVVNRYPKLGEHIRAVSYTHLEHSAEEDRYDFVTDILIRYKNLKKIYGYKIKDYWSNISTVDAYYKTNMDFLKPEVRNYFFKQLPSIYSKVTDLPPAKYNPGAVVKNSLVASGSIINGTVENSVLFKKVFVGNNCVIKNSIILNDVYLGDNTYLSLIHI